MRELEEPNHKLDRFEKDTDLLKKQMEVAEDECLNLCSFARLPYKL